MIDVAIMWFDVYAYINLTRIVCKMTAVNKVMNINKTI
ncbi:hypothetical protein T03_2365 [Trichinella britovi]|uniref:Uncharacterized protein n=1 Tax=Trichinella britovi TaxID=45882 RepID=A0A0V1ALS1_TRIBR|nr:hypothetical protein T03_2365 [Trichinella britovi]